MENNSCAAKFEKVVFYSCHPGSTCMQTAASSTTTKNPPTLHFLCTKYNQQEQLRYSADSPCCGQIEDKLLDFITWLRPHSVHMSHMGGGHHHMGSLMVSSKLPSDLVNRL